MADSDEVNSSRAVFYEGDVSYLRTNSEAIMGKFAGQSNFLNKFQTDIKEFKLNGSYSVASGITFFDGVASFFYNSEIVGVSFYNGKSGTSGTTTFDLRWINSSGVDQGSILSPLASINSTASDEAIGFKNLITGTSVAPTGVILPTFTKTTFLEGESVYMKLAQSMTAAQNCGLTIFYRPIN